MLLKLKVCIDPRLKQFITRNGLNKLGVIETCNNIPKLLSYSCTFLNAEGAKVFKESDIYVVLNALECDLNYRMTLGLKESKSKSNSNLVILCNHTVDDGDSDEGASETYHMTIYRMLQKEADYLSLQPTNTHLYTTLQ